MTLGLRRLIIGTLDAQDMLVDHRFAMKGPASSAATPMASRIKAVMKVPLAVKA